jgi:hypothetical protein
MTGKRVAVPLAKTGNHNVDRALEALTANVNGIVGQEPNASELTKLDPAIATSVQMAIQINALIERLQGSQATARANRPEPDPPAPPPAP